MAGSYFGCEQDITNGHIWGTYPDYIPDVNRMFLLGKCWAKCLNACNVLSIFLLKSRYPHLQCNITINDTSCCVPLHLWASCNPGMLVLDLGKCEIV
jgi:hypothetical protein